MTRPPLPRFRADLQVVIDLSAVDEARADELMALLADDIARRLDKSTFSRRPGHPTAISVSAIGEAVRL